MWQLEYAAPVWTGGVGHMEIVWRFGLPTRGETLSWGLR